MSNMTLYFLFSAIYFYKHIRIHCTSCMFLYTPTDFDNVLGYFDRYSISIDFLENGFFAIFAFWLNTHKYNWQTILPVSL